MLSERNPYAVPVLLAWITSVLAIGAGEKTLKDFFLPIPPRCPLVGKGVWGGANVLPRDVCNGLEDKKLEKWCYWDGSIVKGPDGKYHMFASRWTQAVHHSRGWRVESKGIHAVSDHFLGPYRDTGLLWPQWRNGQGHNVMGLIMDDGRYAAVTSECTDGEVFAAHNPEGPFEYLGRIQVDYNGFHSGQVRYNGGSRNMSNVMILLRPTDGRYMLVPRQCSILISDRGITGPYRVLSYAVYSTMLEMPKYRIEDPTIWYSDGLYHMVVNCWDGDISFHMTSEDGIHDWRYRGLAMNSRKAMIFRYTNGVVNAWKTVQRPTAFVENGHLRAFNFSVIDSGKGGDGPNDNHGSKIVVVPIDTEGFSQYIRKLVEREHAEIDATRPPEPWRSCDLREGVGGHTGFDPRFDTFWVHVAPAKGGDPAEAGRFVYREARGATSFTGIVMSQDITPHPPVSGLMFRAELKEGSPFVMVTIHPQQGIRLAYRSVSSGMIRHLSGPHDLAPYWFRLVHRDRQTEVYFASSGHRFWQKLAVVPVSFAGKFFAGFWARAPREGDKPVLARFKKPDLHMFGNPPLNRIFAHTIPQVIPVSGQLPLEFEYEAAASLRIKILLRDVSR